MSPNVSPLSADRSRDVWIPRGSVACVLCKCAVAMRFELFVRHVQIERRHDARQSACAGYFHLCSFFLLLWFVNKISDNFDLAVASGHFVISDDVRAIGKGWAKPDATVATAYFGVRRAVPTLPEKMTRLWRDRRRDLPRFRSSAWRTSASNSVALRPWHVQSIFTRPPAASVSRADRIARR